MNSSKPDKYAEICMKDVSGTFAALYARNRDVCENQMSVLPNERMINKLFGKFSKREHDLNRDCRLPRSPKDLTFEERVEKWKKVFGSNTSPCSEDIHKYTFSVNRMCNAFLFGWLKEDQFRCLVIDRGLLLPLYAEIQLKLFSLLDENPDIMLHHLADNDNKFRSLIAHLNMVENKETRAYMKMVKDEFVLIEEIGALPSLTYSKCAAPIVVMRKAKGSTRICADFSTGLNSSLEDNHHPLPVIDTHFTILNGGKLFAKMPTFGCLPLDA
ncbi:unnamed protein product [Hymenolepis diminuta]|uniref:Sulfotransfer_1 domain-containing protein n=1 Tax=Hymenolepis diminuta TaxID=6216 RepID=A0A0R3SZI3_HYMDI|nr:unnamed protein product [Hymenolepis diminuta]